MIKVSYRTGKEMQEYIRSLPKTGIKGFVLDYKYDFDPNMFISIRFSGTTLTRTNKK